MPIVRDKSRGTYVFEFDRIVNGGRIRIRKRLPKAWTSAQADEFERKESARIYAAANGVGSEDRLITDAIALYVAERAPLLKQGKNAAREIHQIHWAFNGKPISALAEVCRAVVQKSGKSRYGKEMAPATIRARIRYLVAACRYAWKYHGFGTADPGARVITPQVRNERRVYIDRREMLKIARKIRNRKVRRVIRIAFYSGMRLGEILSARVEGGRWHLDDTKNGEPRIVPIHPRVWTAAHNTSRKPAKITVQSYFREAARALGHNDLHFHDLRHSAASEMINNDIDLYTVGAVLGHKDQRSSARYAHLAVKRLDLAIKKIGQKTPTTERKKAA
ncbi:integrase family protein [Delftia acidovorans SPH-1]|uniref:Integrase family protein n=1 Tax=Delftia acidovorans (strain DSM 14801 / SPH-1) TaxID=398578 RepID=A9BYK6_DELAS|nr:site-specific integrase [Delftia acidovorans]ABX34549.1 integrase family protein [Delftia acidovorans SPH-1]QPS76088.1 site-specific integrase [Delftia acidovorans]